MKIEREAAEGKNTFTGYGDGWVAVNGMRRVRSVLVGAERLEDWPVATLDALTGEAVAGLAELRPEVLLLGTGRSFRFPEPAILAPLHAARIGVEVMDTRAACRTYNLLVGEGRAVLAAVIVD